MFTDGLPQGRGVGTTKRNTPTVVGTAYSSLFFLDGRSDSQWSLALGPLESALEHGGSRTQYAHLTARYYQAEYESIFLSEFVTACWSLELCEWLSWVGESLIA
jgi:cytochrome c peroxidase